MSKEQQAIQFAFKAEPELFEHLDRWRLRQIGPPSRSAAVRWILTEYLREAEPAPAAAVVKRRGKKSTT